MTDITIISDLHGHLPALDGGDLLIIAGDLTARNRIYEYNEFLEWLSQQDYKKKIVIAGNHDGLIQNGKVKLDSSRFNPPGSKIEYLQDSGTEFEGLKVWGSPWSLRFEGMNPHCMAFTVDTDEELKAKWNLIPDDTEILITHMPAYGWFDKIIKYEGPKQKIYIPVGSEYLKEKIRRLKNLKLHICGHIHEYGGWKDNDKEVVIVNASHVNERYEPVNEPIRVIL